MNQHAKNAMDRYLKDLKQALNAAPKPAQEDAVRDAAEFLSNEISSPDAEQLATSEQQVYGHFIECYGSPSQVAAEYLQAQATTPRTMSLPRCWKSLALATIFIMGLVSAVCLAMFREPPKLSPFTQVDFEGDKTCTSKIAPGLCHI